MTRSVQAHYSDLLGAVYAWMTGGAETAIARGAAELSALGLLPPPNGLAVDLGAGIGMHALPLARRGISVIAIDSSALLLDELSAQAGSSGITTIVDDLAGFRRHLAKPPGLILCMGDTLTHLPSHAAVETLLAEIATALAPCGVFVCTFRNYTRELADEARFILVRSDLDRILTCFLEYGPDTVTVHDVLHERAADGWRMRIGSYLTPPCSGIGSRDPRASRLFGG